MKPQNIKPLARRKLVIRAATLSALIVGAIGGWQLYVGRSGYGLPYHARFTPDAEELWTALGGTWEIADGSMRNDSNDRGAKLLTGSRNWKNYIVGGDVQLLGAGSAGVLARVSEPELGEDSFKGYFAGVRTVDNSLVIGAYDFAYREVTKVILPDPVRPLRWYRVRLKVDGCRLTASVWAKGMPEIQTKPLTDPDCFTSGSIGLRSNATGGVWRNVSVVPTDSPDSSAIHDLPSTDTAAPSSVIRRSGTQPPRESTKFVPPQPLVSLQYQAPFGSPMVTVRGSVVLTRPAIFIQDSTNSAVEIQPDGMAPLKVGDEVVVAGEVSLDKFNPVIRKAQVRVLREAVPVSPMVVTSNLAASGSYDGRFIQVEGRLQTVSTEKNGAVSLGLDGGTQAFRAILPPGRSAAHLRDLVLQSRLRIRGVSVADPQFNKDADPFVMLVRSADDVDVAAGPPWWRSSTLILAGLVGLSLIFAINHLYLLAKHWRLRAIAEERERLAHEIHDTLAQSFAGIGFQLQAIRNSLPGGATALEGQVDLALAMTRTSHGEARRSIANLRPKSLEHIGLLPALRECAERMVQSGSVEVETVGDDGGRKMPPRIKDALYRIGQEAIANSIRHARPDKIRIRLQRTRASILLSVEDDGAGFVADSSNAGFGLLGMRKRAESISATLVVRSEPGSGTRVEVEAKEGSPFLLGLFPRLQVFRDI